MRPEGGNVLSATIKQHGNKPSTSRAVVKTVKPGEELHSTFSLSHSSRYCLNVYKLSCSIYMCANAVIVSCDRCRTVVSLNCLVLGD
jgi:hypothetical protein